MTFDPHNPTPEELKVIERCRERWLTEEQIKQYPIEVVQKTVHDFMLFDDPKCTPLPVFLISNPHIAKQISYLFSKMPREAKALMGHIKANSEQYKDSDNELINCIMESISVHKYKELKKAPDINGILHELENAKEDLLVLKYYCGLWWNFRAGWFEATDELGLPRTPNWELFINFNKHCPIWFWDDSFVFILKRPKSVHWHPTLDVLHNTSGPAVEYSDSCKLWEIDGVTVDEQIVMRPETQTIEQIEGESNSDKQSIRIQRFGWARYLAECGAKEIDSGSNDIDGTDEVLYDTKLGKRFAAVCPTGRLFVMGVPSEVENCIQAQNWLAGRAINSAPRNIART